ncbi:peptidyl-tRNA hydrolase-domain-containing protein [Mucor mucedo]|uniref:peptidyl-tRNA hydrolase-domain-containing protein n=1 Tax=Mucor mucedo TaxID=29922 RepID=UPI00221FEFCD|nr:peptidyl-tRNA hydrolase-domain-containing protein [Mucor mucedo]KAI7897025.1 peptidyl-tRNA hydrolase-domain-containing protein [Mucor mucedo]
MNNTRILLVGLGNTTLPNTRHNVGMMALDSIAKALNLNWTQKATWKSDITETTLRVPSADTVKEYQVTFLKPRKLMNISGSCVAQAVKDLSIPLKNLYVFHDDMQRDIGKVNLKGNGSANGHNGIKSVIDNLRTNEFKRVRIGVGRPAAEIDDRSYGVVANFVLGKFTTKELDMLEKTVYPMWTQNQGLELLCDKGELIQSPKKKNKHSNPNKIKKKKKEELFEEHEQLVAQEPHNINIEDK